MSTPASSQHVRAPWRENIEALVMAIAVALAFKVFFLEVSKIPSGSMQPTLIGSDDADVYDRVLVDKLAYRHRDPERFEVVVFQHPLMRSLTMVKRLVGLPGEWLRIQDGDLWTRADEAEPWRVLRRPPEVQEAMWRELDPTGWGVGGARLLLPDGQAVPYRAVSERPVPQRPFPQGAPIGGITDQYLDGYPAALRKRIRPRNPLAGSHPVGDLRVALEFDVPAELRRFEIELTESGRTYRFRVPGPHADAAETCAIAIADPAAAGGERAVAGAAAFRLAAGSRARLRAQNLDDRLELEVDGAPPISAEVAPARGDGSGVRLRADGAAVELRELGLCRDTYYTLTDRTPTRAVHLPEGHYFLLGDNSVDSADGREWQAVTYQWPGADGRVHEARGNFRPGEMVDSNPLRGRAPDGAPLLFFRDEWGELTTFAQRGAIETSPAPAPLVPRDLIRGRALAVFWPLRPDIGVWRLGWIR